MKSIFGCLAIFFSVSLLAQHSSNSEGAIVQTSFGLLRGTKEGDIDIFKGIPYAAPPVGAFRWRPPQPAKAWEGVRDASQFGANCAQAGWTRKAGAIAEGSSEDCLYLNIWRPTEAKPGNKLPVMVWIHGGAFVFGSGSQPDFSGTHFAKQGVILITFNYRLGRLGFFAFPALNNEHPNEPKGNFGYMDQIAALQWVQQNISAFGGDPNNVTIFGESAGGVSVHSLLTIPAAKRFFHKAILQSSGGRDGILTGRPLNKDNSDKFYPISAESTGINFARRHKIEGTDAAALEKLRALSVEEIVDGGAENDGDGGARIYSGPILDGKLVVETFQTAYSAGRVPKIPIIIGSNSAEVPGGFAVSAISKEDLFSQFGSLKDKAKTAYDPNGQKELPEILTMVSTDKVWAEPARFTANAFAKKGVPAYVYVFSYVSDSLKQQMQFGAAHGSEIAYVFNNLETRRGVHTINSTDKMVAESMNAYWVNFAKTGNPNGKGLPEWSVFKPKKHAVLEIQPNGKPVGKPDLKKARLDVIEKETKWGNLHKKGI
jgi:para-nitrobenzyl esterase